MKEDKSAFMLKYILYKYNKKYLQERKKAFFSDYLFTVDDIITPEKHQKKNYKLKLLVLGFCVFSILSHYNDNNYYYQICKKFVMTFPS